MKVIISDWFTCIFNYCALKFHGNGNHTGCSELIEKGDGGFEKYPMFRTGLGKSVSLKESSIAKALYIIGDDDGATTASSSKVFFSPFSFNNLCFNFFLNLFSAFSVDIFCLQQKRNPCDLDFPFIYIYELNLCLD